MRGTLDAQNVSHADATGNVRLQADHPGLLLTATGADRNPWPTDKSLQSLRGTGAMRAVRALLDHTPPYGVRELAGRTNASAATLSRVIDLLERDGLAERDAKGAVADLDWVGTIRRWTQDYDVLATNTAASYLQPRGRDALTDQLRTATARYAVTGSLAARAFAPIAPARLAMVYVEDPRTPPARSISDQLTPARTPSCSSPTTTSCSNEPSTATTSRWSTPHNSRATC